MLYLDPEFGERVKTIFPTYFSFEDTSLGLDGGFKAEREPLRPAAAARGASRSPPARSRCSRPRAWTRSSPARPTSRTCFAAKLAEAGYTVAPRARTTLVSFEVEDPEAKRELLLERGVAVRNLPGTPYLRASVGAWNDESDLDRLLAALQ